MGRPCATEVSAITRIRRRGRHRRYGRGGLSSGPSRCSASISPQTATQSLQIATPGPARTASTCPAVLEQNEHWRDGSEPWSRGSVRKIDWVALVSVALVQTLPACSLLLWAYTGSQRRLSAPWRSERPDAGSRLFRHGRAPAVARVRRLPPACPAEAVANRRKGPSTCCHEQSACRASCAGAAPARFCVASGTAKVRSLQFSLESEIFWTPVHRISSEGMPANWAHSALHLVMI